jgi:hypothetical protein
MNLYDSTNFAIVSLLQVKKLEGMRLDSKTQKAAQAEIDTACYAIRELINAVKDNRLDGGPGSGNWGHIGIPGHWGGSQKGGGNAFRLAYTSYATKKTNYEHVEEEYTSQAKIRKQLHDDLAAAKITGSKEAVEKVQERLSQINDRTKTALTEEDLRKQGYTDEEIAKKFDVVHSIDKEASKHILETDNTNSTGTRAGGKYARGTAEGVKQTKVKKNSSSKKSEGEGKNKGKDKDKSGSESEDDKGNSENQKTSVDETALVADSALIINDEAKSFHIDYKRPSQLTEPLSEQEVIDKVGGQDLTDGSCSSLALSYVANKAGLDVTDMRGGSSQELFSRGSTVAQLTSLDGVDGHIDFAFSPSSKADVIQSYLDMGSEYYVGVGGHAAIMRKAQNGYEYLELQSNSSTTCGWKNITNKKGNIDLKELQRRFGVRGASPRVFTINTKSLSESLEFKELIGYINTKESTN